MTSVPLSRREWLFGKIDLDLKDKTAKYLQPVWKYCGPVSSLENYIFAQENPASGVKASEAHLRPFMEENRFARFKRHNRHRPHTPSQWDGH